MARETQAACCHDTPIYGGVFRTRDPALARALAQAGCALLGTWTAAEAAGSYLFADPPAVDVAFWLRLTPAERAVAGTMAVWSRAVPDVAAEAAVPWLVLPTVPADNLLSIFLYGRAEEEALYPAYARYRASRARGDKRAASFYCSQGTKAGASHARHTITVTVHDAEAFAVRHVLNLLSDSTEAEAALARLAEQREETNSDMEQAVERLAEVQAKIARRRLLLDTITNLDEIAAYGAELDMLHVEEAGWKAEMEALSSKDEHVRTLEATLAAAVHAARAHVAKLRAQAEEFRRTGTGGEVWEMPDGTPLLMLPSTDPQHPDDKVFFPITDPAQPAQVDIPTALYLWEEADEAVAAFEHASNPDKRRVMRALGVHVAAHRGKQRHPETRLEFVLPLGLRSADDPDGGAEGTHSEQNAVAFSTKAISSGAQPMRAAAAE